MMVLLCEISDKMPSIPWMWIQDLLIGLMLIGVCRAHIHAWKITMPIAFAFTCWQVHEAYEEAFLAGHFSMVVQVELGPAWILSSLMTSTLPLLVPATYAVYRWNTLRVDSGSREVAT